MPPVVPRKRLSSPKPNEDTSATRSRKTDSRGPPVKKFKPSLFQALDASLSSTRASTSIRHDDASESDDSESSSAISSLHEDVAEYTEVKEEATPPVASKPVQRRKDAPRRPAEKPKPSLFQTLDASLGSTKANASIRNASMLDSDDSDTSSAVSSLYEDVPLTNGTKRNISSSQGGGLEGGESEDENDMDWEDAIHPSSDMQSHITTKSDHAHISGDLEITVHDPADGDIDFSAFSKGTGDEKRGPTKVEREIRVLTHRMHVQCLLWHNAVRNSWASDPEVQRILVKALGEGMRKEVDRYKKAMCLSDKEEDQEPSPKPKAGQKRQGTKKKKSPGSARNVTQDRAARDWGDTASRLEVGVPNLSAGDPLFRLLKSLSAFWRKRFTVISPALRKLGYMEPKMLKEYTKLYKKDGSDSSIFGEKVEDLAQFRQMATEMKGSRDVGAQLFTALLRGLGLESRVVVSLQTIGFGWSSREEVTSKRTKILRDAMLKAQGHAKQSNTPSRKQSVKDDDSSELSDLASEASEEITPSKKTRGIDGDIAFPTYWTEVLSPVNKAYIPVDPLVTSSVAVNPDLFAAFEPSGKKAEKVPQIIAYVIAFSHDRTAKDVTVRYLKRQQFPGKTKGVRTMPEKIAIRTRKGKVKRYEQMDWLKTALSVYRRPEGNRTAADDIEDTTTLVPRSTKLESKDVEKKESLQFYKQSEEFILARHLKREQAIIPEAKPVRTFKDEPVYLRKDVRACKTVESWHKEGREVCRGEHPLKLVPIRAVTIMRKREIQETERDTGEKATQGLYSRAQTQWIIPPPIENGMIPRNAFDNIDIYVPSMVPRGAAHVRLKGTGKICKKLNIDYAEACVGFEFGKQRAVPVINGVVVAKENEKLLRDAWKQEEEMRMKREEEKVRKSALGLWKKFLVGLRIMERMKEEYTGDIDHIPDEMNPFTNTRKQTTKKQLAKKKTSVANDPVEEVKHDFEEAEAVADQGDMILSSSDEAPEPGGFFIE